MNEKTAEAQANNKQKTAYCGHFTAAYNLSIAFRFETLQTRHKIAQTNPCHAQLHLRCMQLNASSVFVKVIRNLFGTIGHQC